MAKRIEHIAAANDIYPYLWSILPSYERPPVIFEIGAARGEDTEEIRLICPDSIYVAFEPDPRNLELLHAKDFGNIMIEEMAVGNEDGEVKLHLSSGWNPHAGDRQKYDHWLSNSIRKPKKHLEIAPWCKFEDEMIVPITKLDTYHKKLDCKLPVNFIWCDIQGAEQDMLLGAQDVLKTVDYLYMEYSNDELYEGQIDLEGLMRLLPDSFELVHRFTDDVLLRNNAQCQNG